jgi:tetratricopeptide (TPR) repeat protein
MNEDEFYKATDLLKELSLITIEEDDDGEEFGIKIHRTLQNESRKYLETKYLTEYNRILAKQLASVNEIIKQEKDIEWNKWSKHKYYNNFKKIIDNSLENNNLEVKRKAELAEHFASYSQETNLALYNSIRYYKKSMEFNQELFRTDEHSSIANNLNNIALVYSNLGNHKESLENYSKSLEIDRKLFGTDENISIAQTLNNIASVYSAMEKYEEALQNYTTSLEIKRNIFKTDENVSIAATLNNIASVYDNLERHEEAL